MDEIEKLTGELKEEREFNIMLVKKVAELAAEVNSMRAIFAELMRELTEDSPDSSSTSED